MATGQAGTFGESGQRFSATVEDTPSNSRELLARVDFEPNTDAEWNPCSASARIWGCGFRAIGSGSFRSSRNQWFRG